MQILLVADGRSSHTRSWVKTILALGHEITLISSYPCDPIEGVQADLCMPVAFANWVKAGSVSDSGVGNQGGRKKLVSSFRSLFLAARYRLGPLTLRYYGPRFRGLVEKIKPDLVHALRIPFEGMLATYTPPGIPLAVSLWGNDLTLHAAASSEMADRTRQALKRADALLADTQRDVRLACSWGFSTEKPFLVVPGGGGIDQDRMQEVRTRYAECGLPPSILNLPPETPLVVNPRGFRTGSVRQDTFFAALPLLLSRRPNTAFACPAMKDDPEALRMVEKYHLQGKVHLLPRLSQAELWSLFLRAQITVSVSQHDGTPNSLLEAFALGCFPVAGDIESIREWITPGVNGLLVEPDKPQALAEAIQLGLDSPDLRGCAEEKNTRLIAERAEAGVVRAKIDEVYHQITASQ